MGSLRTNLAEMQLLVTKAEQLEQRIEERLAACEKRVEELHISWSGSAAAAHRANHEAWQCGAKRAHEALGKLRAATENAHNNYSAAIEANVKMWPDSA